ncbi:MAG: hypothetical protein ACKVOI_14965 [Dongiaceae bacterium]
MRGVAGNTAAIAVLTPGYKVFQAANNTAGMMELHPEQRGVISGMLSLSRNLGLITGASVIGAVFALASTAIDISTACPEAIAAGMQITFAVAATLVAVVLALAVGSRAVATRPSAPGRHVMTQAGRCSSIANRKTSASSRAEKHTARRRGGPRAS